VCGLFTLTSEAMGLREQRDEAREDVADLTAALAEATATLADARVVIPLRPRGIPVQRGGAHDAPPVADGVFPIHTAVDDDDLTALMRATEEK